MHCLTFMSKCETITYFQQQNHKPLTIEQTYQDVSKDYAMKTVTMEAHPHLSVPKMASVHPCR